MERKIFCVGHPKTGTHSLNEALNMLGIKSTHNIPKIKKAVASNIKTRNKLLTGYEEFDAYCDIVFKHYVRLEQEYPHSLFICTWRNPHEIALSCVRHFYRFPDKGLEGNYEKLIVSVNHFYGSVFRFFFTRQNRFLILRVCDGEGWDVLCPFLGKEIPKEEFPWKFKHDTDGMAWPKYTT